jgi:hypothetical protein
MGKEDFRSRDDQEAARTARGVDESVTEKDGGPYDPDDAMAGEGLVATSAQAAHYEEMTAKGANQAGEGNPEV